MEYLLCVEEGTDPQTFLNAIYSHENCPNGLLLYLSLPILSNPEVALDSSFWEARSFIPKEERVMILTNAQLCQCRRSPMRFAKKLESIRKIRFKLGS